MRRWLEALPDEVIRVRPVLSVGYAGALMVSGQTEGVEARLRDAERWLTAPPDRGQDPPHGLDLIARDGQRVALARQGLDGARPGGCASRCSPMDLPAAAGAPSSRRDSLTNASKPWRVTRSRGLTASEDCVSSGVTTSVETGRTVIVMVGETVP